jgi:hypothetical protein
MMRQIHGHIDNGHGVLSGLITVADAEWEAHIPYTDAVDGNAAIIMLVLRVFESWHG